MTERGQENKTPSNILAEYGLPIISAVIGSSLLLSIITMLASEINKPSMHIYVERHSSFRLPPEQYPEKNYYEVIARNDGRMPATNLKLSMFFFAPIKDAKVLLNSSDYVLKITNNTQPSAVANDSKRLSQLAQQLTILSNNKTLSMNDIKQESRIISKQLMNLSRSKTPSLPSSNISNKDHTQPSAITVRVDCCPCLVQLDKYE